MISKMQLLTKQPTFPPPPENGRDKRGTLILSIGNRSSCKITIGKHPRHMRHMSMDRRVHFYQGRNMNAGGTRYVMELLSGFWVVAKGMAGGLGQWPCSRPLMRGPKREKPGRRAFSNIVGVQGAKAINRRQPAKDPC